MRNSLDAHCICTCTYQTDVVTATCCLLNACIQQEVSLICTFAHGAHDTAFLHVNDVTPTYFLLEAHVQQPVSLIQHQPAQLISLEGGCLLKVVQQAAWAGHQHRDALAQPRLLLVALLPTQYAATHLQSSTPFNHLTQLML